MLYCYFSLNLCLEVIISKMGEKKIHGDVQLSKSKGEGIALGWADPSFGAQPAYRWAFFL